MLFARLAVSALVLGGIWALGAPKAVAVSAEPSESVSEIQVLANVELEMERDLTVGDVTDFRGFEEREIAELKTIRLGEAPSRGEARVIATDELATVFRSHLPRLQEGRSERIRLLIPARLTVTRKTLRLEASQVERELRRQLSAICSGCEIEIPRLNVPAVGELPKGAEWTIRQRPELPRGNFSVPLEVTSAAGRRMFWVTGEVRIWKRVPVAKRAFEAGERITTADYAIERKDVTFANDAYPSEIELESSIAARAIAAQSPIGRAWVRREPVLKVGQVVRVAKGNEGWQVSVEGVAQQSGYIGDTVRIKIPSTQKIVSGILREKGLVEVQ